MMKWVLKTILFFFEYSYYTYVYIKRFKLYNISLKKYININNLMGKRITVRDHGHRDAAPLKPMTLRQSAKVEPKTEKNVT